MGRGTFQLHTELFWNEKGKEIDFILHSDEITEVEVKLKNSVPSKDTRWLIEKDLNRRFMVVRPDTQVRGKLDNVEKIPLHRVSEIDE